jgi:Tfp pilus assembly protein PilF
MKGFIFIALLIAFGCSSTKKKEQAKLSEMHYGYGTEALVSKNYTEAISHLLKASVLDPKNTEVHNNLGMAYYFKGDLAMAESHIQKAITLDEKNTDALSNLASLRFEKGDIAGAEKLYKQCLKDLTYEKTPRIYFNLSLVEMRKGNGGQSEAYLQLALKEDETYCPAWFQMGQIEYKNRQLKTALKSFRQAGMGACVNDPAPLYWQGVVMAELGDFIGARMKLDEVETRFARTTYGAMAREKISRLNLQESQFPTKQADKKLLDESLAPSF